MLDFDSGTRSALRKGLVSWRKTVKTPAVVQGYAEGRISQSKAAEILGVNRARFLDELCRRRVPAG